MKKEEVFEESMNTGAQAEAPHFDDEQTLLSARQVVPLERIDAKVRRRRQWFLGGAFAAAMMLGAASALLASYLKLRNVNNAATEVTQVELTATTPLTPSIEATGIGEPESVANLEETEPLVTDEEVAVEPAVEPKKEPVTRRRTVAQPQPDFVPSQAPRMSEEDELDRIRDAVLYDEWQERRARRAIRRERRRERDNRDLSNLDEIFEGRRRRLNP
jgi:hypothetical protein